MTIPATSVSGNFDDFVVDLLKSHEGFAAGEVYFDIFGVPTVGYGFALSLGDIPNLSFRSDLNTALSAASISWSTAQKDFIEDLMDDLNTGTITISQANAVMSAEYGSGGLFENDELTVTQGEDLIDYALNDILADIRIDTTVIGSSTIGDIFQAFETSHADTKQLAALYSMAYNSPSLIGKGISHALNDDNFAHAWVEIAYNHAAAKGQSQESEGLMARRLSEAKLFADADGGGFKVVSSSATTQDILEVMNALFNDQGTDSGGTYNLYDRIQDRDGIIGSTDFSFETILSGEFGVLEAEYTDNNAFDFLQYAEDRKSVV